MYFIYYIFYFGNLFLYYIIYQCHNSLCIEYNILIKILFVIKFYLYTIGFDFLVDMYTQHQIRPTIESIMACLRYNLSYKDEFEANRIVNTIRTMFNENERNNSVFVPKLSYKIGDQALNQDDNNNINNSNTNNTSSISDKKGVNKIDVRTNVLGLMSSSPIMQHLINTGRVCNVTAAASVNYQNSTVTVNAALSDEYLNYLFSSYGMRLHKSSS